MNQTMKKFHLREKERSFILDCIAVDSIASGYARLNPKLWGAIPPYNAQHDKHTRLYFKPVSVKALLRKTGQDHLGTSAGGHVVDYFHICGPDQRFLNRRNWAGAGYSEEEAGSHAAFLSNIKPMVGYSGRYGYRRNTPFLRQKTSCFGEVTCFPLH
ncbi:sperm microtubule associated protein 1 [Latimeria chalumnae]|uniref:Sperm microtubule associated protein 1 n=1 Tax=Latimeria chalumnae TaxID=7897 RepID=H2ZTS3_LATCH|nr:PREDICTED: uncharacterized protein C17orf98 homolog [Latimeria chalumnae]|eukprot:XP_006010904.1 PREDICTED: uncharacterized protein C17orf98 homolog [Latimeria chalumnae]